MQRFSRKPVTARWIVTWVMLLAGVLCSVLAAAPADARAVQAAPHLVASGSCPNSPSQTYPISPSATIQTSTQTPYIGETITISGVGYCPDEDVVVTFRGHRIKTVHTNSDGSFDPFEYKVTGPTGPVEACGNGASGLADDQDCVALTVSDNGTGGTGTGSGGNGGGTAFTGVEIAGLIVLALVLLGGGGALVVAGRRRKAVPVDALR